MPPLPTASSLKYSTHVRIVEKDIIEDAQKATVDGIIKRNVWTVFDTQETTSDATTIGERFVFTVGRFGTSGKYAKVRFNGQGFEDSVKPIIVNDTAILRESSI